MNYTYCDLDFKLAERYVRCVLSMDTLYRAKAKGAGEESLRNEGVVPVILSEFKFDQMESWDEIRAELKDVYAKYSGIKNDIRMCYMLEQVHSIVTLGDWLFGKREYEYRELVANALFLNHNKIAKHQIDRERAELETLLANKGYKGSFLDKFSKWQSDNLIRPADLQKVLDDVAEDTRRYALNVGFDEIADVDVKNVVVNDRPFSAYCDYPGKAIYVNGDMEYTYHGIKRLMCHEVHPGHVTHMHIRKLDYEKGLVPADAILVISNTASSGVFEGLADNGQLFVGWDNEIDDAIARIYNNLTGMVGISMAHMLHEEKVAPDIVKRYFIETLGKSEAAADSKMRFLSFPVRRPFIYSYWRGNEAVRKIFLRLEKHETWAFLRFAYHNMHSVNSISQFLA